MSFRNFNCRSDGLRYDFSTNKLKYSSYLYTSEPRGKDSAPRILRVFIRPPAKFRQSFASPVLEKSRFFCYGEIFLPNTQGPLGCLLGFWPSGPKPCGGNYFSSKGKRYRRDITRWCEDRNFIFDFQILFLAFYYIDTSVSVLENISKLCHR